MSEACIAERVSSAQIGPNALTQSARALSEQLGAEEARALLTRGGLAWLLDTPPHQMVDEAAFLALAELLERELDSSTAAALLRQAGVYTAHYLLAHRIPRLFQWLLRYLPRRLRLRFLLAAITRHAWTFVGSGRFAYALEFRPSLLIARDDCAPQAVFAFYGGTFTTLLRTLVDRRIVLEETVTQLARGGVCLYRLRYVAEGRKPACES